MTRSAPLLAILWLAYVSAPTAQAGQLPPVYVHMNGANMFLENVVAVHPGQEVVFVNEDTGAHTIIGYDPATGQESRTFHGTVKGVTGPAAPVSAYSIRFASSGLHYYYCSVHAALATAPGGVTLPKMLPNVDGFGTPMAGLIIVTTDPALLRDNPKTAAEKILPAYFGG